MCRYTFVSMHAEVEVESGVFLCLSSSHFLSKGFTQNLELATLARLAGIQARGFAHLCFLNARIKSLPPYLVW